MRYLSSQRPLALFSAFLLMAGVFAVAGCDSAGPGEEEQTSASSVSVGLTSSGTSRASATRARSAASPARAADIEEAIVMISSVELIGEDGRFTLSEETQEIDLLGLGSDVRDLALGKVPAGEYDRLLLKVTEARLTLSDGSQPNLKVPSEKIKLLLPGFEVEEEGDEAQITASFDVEESFVKAGKSGKYIFKPTVRAESVEVNGEDRDGNVEAAGQVTAYVEGESVAVEGLEFTITEDTEIGEELALEEGQGVELEGARSEGGSGYVAQEIEARSGDEEEGAALEAPIGEVRPEESSVVLLGTPFEVDADTEFEGFDVLSGLESGSRAEVAFTYDAASGTYTALEIESASSGEGDEDEGDEKEDDDENEDNEEAAEVKGRVTSAPAEEGSVSVEGLEFAVTGGTEAGGEGGLEAIEEGDFVELEATYTSDGTLVAAEIEETGETEEPASLEAPVDSVSSGAITLLGESFAANEDTQLDDFDALEELEQGDEVEVEFAYDAEADTYRALKIESDGSGRNDE